MANPIPNLWRIPELKSKLIFTLGVLLLYRVGAHITTPGINYDALQAQFGALQGTLLGVYDMFVGGALSRATVFALGIMPYISASIMFQLLAAVFPSIEKMQKEGEEGRKKLTQYTRYATVGLSAAQAYGYSIFLAEIASTVNEVLLNWHLLNQPEGQDPVQRFALLNRFADTYLGTVSRQTMFAEFEQRTHDIVESGGALVPEVLSDLYAELFATYNPGVDIDDSVRITWARIPHFYTAFYVYQYATGMSSAINLATAVRDEGDAARDRYLKMLAAGGSDYPMNVLKAAGVDLETSAPIERGIEEFERVLSEMEKLADEGVLEQAAAQLEAAQ